jgi:hypothetical protein
VPTADNRVPSRRPGRQHRLEVIARRCTVLGFDKVDDITDTTPRTVVVAGNREEYIATLKELIDGQV